MSEAKKKPVKKTPAKKSAGKSKASGADVMSKIRDDQVSMKPSWHFGALGFVLGIAIILAGFLAALAMSAIIAEIKEASDLSLFEHRGSDAVRSLPWVLMVIMAGLVYASVRLIKKLDFSYKHRSYIMFGSLALVLILMAGFMSAINFSDSFRERGPLKPFSTLSKYQNEKLLRGEVTEITDMGFLLQYKPGDVVEVSIDKNIPGYEFIEVDEEVIVFGEFVDEQKDTFDVEIIRPLHKRGVRGIFNKPPAPQP